MVSTYTPPGVYTSEVVVPNGSNVASTPAQIGIIGIGDRQKRINDEVIVRGLVEGESLSISVIEYTSVANLAITAAGGTYPTDCYRLNDPTTTTPFPAVGAGVDIVGLSITISGGTTNPNTNKTFTIYNREDASNIIIVASASPIHAAFTGSYTIAPYDFLANRANRALQNTTVYNSSGAVVSDTYLAYSPAFIQGNSGAATATRNLPDITGAYGPVTEDNTMCLALDGKVPLTLRITSIYGLNVGGGRALQIINDTTFDIIDPDKVFTGWTLIGRTVTLVNTSVGAIGDGNYVVVSEPNATTLRFTHAPGLGAAAPSVPFNVTTRYYVVASATQVGGSTGTEYHAFCGDIVNTAVTNTLIAAGINAALNASPYYGSTYSGVARALTQGIRLVSPLATPASDVQVLPPMTEAATATSVDMNATTATNSTLFSGAWAAYSNTLGLKASSRLTISRMVTGTTPSGYTVDYVNVDSNSDTMGAGVYSSIQSVVRVGSYPGVGTYAESTDWQQVGDALFWGDRNGGPDYPATWPLDGVSGTPSAAATLGASDALLLAIDGKTSLAMTAVDATPTAGTAHILGYSYGASPCSDESILARNINAKLCNSGLYGNNYKSVASAVAVGANFYVKLTSYNDGKPGQVQVLTPAANTGNFTVFGLAAGTTVSEIGTGSRPALASNYYVTYRVARPSSGSTNEYNIQKRFYTLDSARADLGYSSSDNDIMVACELAFVNNAPSVVVVQVNDSTAPGTPTRQQWLDALNATINTDVVTEVVMLTTDLAVQTDVRDHLENQNSLMSKHYRRGWFGMARSTVVGDKDTANSLVYRARRTMQVVTDSPARGRMVLMAPPQLTGVSRDVTLEDGSTLTIDLDGTYLAAAVAAKRTSFLSPADSMARKTVTGFNINDITNPWTLAEIGLLAGQGVMVVRYDAGSFRIDDPVTTEKGGGALDAFSYESTSPQKDNISRKIQQAMDAQLIGMVPSSPSDFRLQVMLVAAGVISGEIANGAIGPYTNQDGSARPINPTRDIVVLDSQTDRTRTDFGFWYALRYPKLRIFGQFSVDSPWWNP